MAPANTADFNTTTFRKARFVALRDGPFDWGGGGGWHGSKKYREWRCSLAKWRMLKKTSKQICLETKLWNKTSLKIRVKYLQSLKVWSWFRNVSVIGHLFSRETFFSPFLRQYNCVSAGFTTYVMIKSIRLLSHLELQYQVSNVYRAFSLKPKRDKRQRKGRPCWCTKQ